MPTDPSVQPAGPDETPGAEGSTGPRPGEASAEAVDLAHSLFDPARHVGTPTAREAAQLLGRADLIPGADGRPSDHRVDGTAGGPVGGATGGGRS